MIAVIKLPDSVAGARPADYVSSVYDIHSAAGWELKRRRECTKHSHQLDVVGIHNNWDVNNASHCLAYSIAGFSLSFSAPENETFNFHFISTSMGI
jgi:hypothetical protein